MGLRRATFLPSWVAACDALIVESRTAVAIFLSETRRLSFLRLTLLATSNYSFYVAPALPSTSVRNPAHNLNTCFTQSLPDMSDQPQGGAVGGESTNYTLMP